MDTFILFGVAVIAGAGARIGWGAGGAALEIIASAAGAVARYIGGRR